MDQKNEPIDYATLERTYKECMASGHEPDMMWIRPLPKTPKMLRRIGRLVRRGLAQKGDILECINARGVWCGVVRV